MHDCHILIVDDDTDVLVAAEMVLKRHFTQPLTEHDPSRVPELLKQHNFEVILLDMNYTPGLTAGQEGLDLLKLIQSQAPDTKVIMMTAYGAIETAVKAIKEGAADFVVKPWQNEKLVATVAATLRYSQAARRVKDLSARQKVLSQYIAGNERDIIGGSDAMRGVLRNIDKVARTDASVLILGENGTGKELVARAIHQRSARADQPFVHVDLGAITESLFESELFGHKKGAFTDAKEDRAGRFEVASGGTLFLDEIGNLSLPMQAKLLGVLETRSVTRVGSDRPIPLDVRIICATNTPIEEMLDSNHFRQDLLYRINTVELHVPPLRERRSDIPLLIEHYVEQFARKYSKQPLHVSSATLEQLVKYNWPGNVRELVRAVERAVIMSEDSTLSLEQFLFQNRRLTLSVEEDLNLDLLEKKAIEQAVLKHQGNLSKAAKELGLGRTTLYRKMAKHGL